MSTRAYGVGGFIRASLAALVLAAASTAATAQVVISQVYGGGGNTGATLRNDFVELFNRGSSVQDVSGWCVQYASATGSFSSGASQNTPLNGSIAAGGYYLVQLAQGTGGSQNLPTPDAIGTTAMSGSAGKVALLSGSCSTALGDTEAISGGRVADFVGYGSTANRSEGNAPTVNLTNTTSVSRANNGCTDGNNNSTDFASGNPGPRNSAATTNVCSGGNAAIATSCPSPVSAEVGVGTSRAVSAVDSDGIVITAALVSVAVPGITLDGITPAASLGGTLNATLSVAPSVGLGSYLARIRFSNADSAAQTAECTITVNITGALGATRIRDIQGRAHISPLNGQSVSGVPGIVTATRGNGFWFQDPNPDSDPATSEGIFVFTATAPAVAVGDAINVAGTVGEFRPGGSGGLNNLTISQIASPTVIVVSSSNPLPPPIVIGIGGRVPPNRVIDNDATTDVELNGTFDPLTDGIDFYESLEGMRVQINNAVAVGPTSRFGEIAVIGDDGVNATLRTARGGIAIAPDDFNPERIIIDDALAPTPAVNVGDRAASIVGIMDYSFSNFKLLVTTSPVFSSVGLLPETTVAQRPNQLAIAAYNVENLEPSNPPAKFAAIAAQIINNLKTPDIVTLIEIQDNNGATNDAVTSANVTYGTLIAAIQAAGGPVYQFRQIDPVDDQDGGEPGGNIRVGFLFNQARVTFVDRVGGTSTNATTVVAGSGGPTLSVSPGRIDPTNAAFASSRKPLAAEFLFNGHRLFVIANHFNSKGGDQPLFGRFQPPQRSSEVQRTQQATIVANFVSRILAIDADAKVVVLGDLNDFEFSPTLTILKNAGLRDLVDGLPADDRYTYVFEGNSQSLDHILVSESLYRDAAPEYDIVHINSEFAAQTSDHDPEVVRLSLSPVVVDVTGSVTVVRSGVVFNRATQLFHSRLTITNTSAAALTGPLQVRLDGLTSGVTLANAAGTNSSAPYVSVPITALNAGASTTVEVRFSNPARIAIAYAVRVFSGTF